MFTVFVSSPLPGAVMPTDGSNRVKGQGNRGSGFVPCLVLRPDRDRVEAFGQGYFWLNLPLTRGTFVPLTQRLSGFISVTVPVRLIVGVFTNDPFTGAVIWITGAIVSRVRETDEVDSFPALSFARTVMVFKPSVRVTVWLKLPFTSVTSVPLTQRPSELTSVTVPETVIVGVLTNDPLTGAVIWIAGAMVSSVRETEAVDSIPGLVLCRGP